MMRDQPIEHLLRRAGFGASAAELDAYAAAGYGAVVDRLVDFERVPDDVDANIGRPGFVAVTSRGEFSPNTVIQDARQRWLFRMVHSQRPLQEKMALFWHNHFATAYSKIQGALPGTHPTRVMAAKPSEDPARVTGQLELLRQHALGNFRDLLVAITKDPAMLVWLDGRNNVRSRPQENYARELMELFTMGVGHYTEQDVYAGARVFTGWNLRLVGGRDDPAAYYEFVYVPNQHDTTAKEFSFPIYRDGGRTIPARPASDGMQDGLDLIDACARHPETARRLARLLWRFFVSELTAPDEAFVETIASLYLRSNYEMRPVVRAILTSFEFTDPASWYGRYSWPVEYVVRAIKEIGWTGFTVNDALTPLINMGQQLFEPPDVAGWALGRDWFSTGTMLSRMNFASALTSNQKFALRDASRPFGSTPAALLSSFMDRLHLPDVDTRTIQALTDYLNAGGPWTGSDAQVLTKAAGLAHLMLGSAEYQFV
jgi:uncharacterized protein (DUF1800 family)